MLSLSLARWAALHRPTSTYVKSRSNGVRLSLSLVLVPKNFDAFRIHTSKETNKARWESRSQSGVTSFRLFSSLISEKVTTRSRLSICSRRGSILCLAKMQQHLERERVYVLNSLTFSTIIIPSIHATLFTVS